VRFFNPLLRTTRTNQSFWRNVAVIHLQSWNHTNSTKS